MADEYMFFDEALGRRFLELAAARGLAGTLRADAMEGWVVELPEADDDVAEALEAHYAELMTEQRDMVEADDAPGARKLMAVNVTLDDGQVRQVRLPGELGRRLLEHFDIDEINALAAAIARDVAHPVSGPLCRDP